MEEYVLVPPNIIIFQVHTRNLLHITTNYLKCEVTIKLALSLLKGEVNAKTREESISISCSGVRSPLQFINVLWYSGTNECESESYFLHSLKTQPGGS